MKRHYVLLFIMLLVCTLLLVGCGPGGVASTKSSGTLSQVSGGGKKVVNILSCNYEEQITIQKDYLQELYPDAEINITYMSSGSLAMKAKAEGADLEADILLSLSSGYANILKKDGLLQPFTSASSYKEEYTDPDSLILPNGVWCGVILVNTEEMTRLGLPEPTSYEDLLDPIYQGHIVMASPTSSSTGYFFLHGLLNLYGEEAGWQYFDSLHENIMMFGESGSFPSTRVEMGEAAIGLAIDYEGMKMVADGKPVKVIIPKEGAPYDYDTVLLVNKNGEPSEFVLEVMQTITSAEGNAVFNNYNIAVLEGEKDRMEYPDNFSLLDMTGITDADLKTSILEKWSQRYE